MSPEDTPRAHVRCGFCLTLNRISMDRASDRPRCGKCEKPMLLDRPLKVTADDFETTVLKSDVPVLVDFYADWCGPCHMLAPHLDAIAGEEVGRMLVAKVDSDRAQALAQRYGISGLPTVVLFDRGEEVQRVVGMDPQGIRTMVAQRVADPAHPTPHHNPGTA